jgi:hypothetical protein
MQNVSINWIENNIKYVGEGRAEFANPKIILEGPVRIEFKESGESNIQMDFKNVSGDIDTNVLELINRDVSTNEYFRIHKFVNQIESSQCTKLEVFTSKGTFSSIGTNIKHYIPNNLNSTLIFFCLASQFEAYGREAKYWALPLYNFLTHFYKYPCGWTNPLCINNRNIGIIFNFNCGTCFIEPLEDYEIIEEELINFKNPKRITSIMIGELRSLPKDLESLDQQVPINFLELLGLATGTEVGSPWVEFRTADGDLVKRIHVALNDPIYSKGHLAIDESWDPGIDILLNNGQSLLHLGNSYMIATLKHLVRAGSRNLNTDEKLTHLFQALDGLCETFDLKTQHLHQRINTSQQKQIREILKRALQDILAISSAAIDDKQSQAIREIANRTSSNPAGTARDFGLSLSDLLGLFNLADMNIIEKYYQTSKNGKSWIKFISHCRGVEIHTGFLDFYGDEFDPKEIDVIRAHLHDILFRLVFKMLHYDGIYRSPIQPLPNTKEVDWVKPNTSPKMLGYH